MKVFVFCLSGIFLFLASPIAWAAEEVCINERFEELIPVGEESPPGVGVHIYKRLLEWQAREQGSTRARHDPESHFGMDYLHLRAVASKGVDGMELVMQMRANVEHLHARRFRGDCARTFAANISCSSTITSNSPSNWFDYWNTFAQLVSGSVYKDDCEGLALLVYRSLKDSGQTSAYMILWKDLEYKGRYHVSSGFVFPCTRKLYVIDAPKGANATDVKPVLLFTETHRFLPSIDIEE